MIPIHEDACPRCGFSLDLDFECPYCQHTHDGVGFAEVLNEVDIQTGESTNFDCDHCNLEFYVTWSGDGFKTSKTSDDDDFRTEFRDWLDAQP